jgi:hypothetical protein
MKLDMGLGGFARVMLGVLVMGVGEMGMMRAGFVVAVGDMSGGSAVMIGGLFVMLCGVLMMLGGVLGVSHGRLPYWPRLADGAQ